MCVLQTSGPAEEKTRGIQKSALPVSQLKSLYETAPNEETEHLSN